MMTTIDNFYSSHPALGSIRKLNLGCGANYMQGWCNIDAYPSTETDTHRGVSEIQPDIWADISKLPAQDNSVDIICTHHVIEHFYRHKAVQLLNEFKRVLKPGGVIITEMPDLSRVIALLRFLPRRPSYPPEMHANRDMILAQLYGASWEANDDDYPYHKYVWQRSEFCKVLDELGLKLILATGATKTHVPFRDMAVVCQKPYIGSGAGVESEHAVNIRKSYGSKFTRFKRQLTSVAALAFT